ncbi:MAG TPA: hypothetical protein VF054_11340 [Micromonosporaceae bacterium]
MRVPTSVLLAVLAAAGLLALAPALVRRYDATERLVAERALSTARVLARCGTTASDAATRRRRRTVPGRHPVNPPRAALAAAQAAGSGAASATDARGAHPGRASRPAARGNARRVVRSAARRRHPVGRHTPSVYRRRRVFAGLVLLNAVEIVGVLVVGPSFWVGFAVTALLLVAYTGYLRRRAVAEQRRRRIEARRLAWLAAREEEARLAQQRRLAARREALRRAAAARAAAQREQLRLSQRYAAADPARRGPVRGRPYSQRAAGF